MRNILFFDTETTGLPKNWDAPVTDFDNWPRLVQLAWQIYNSKGDLIEEKEYIIRPEGFIIPKDSNNIHKITTEIALAQGVNLNLVLNDFISITRDSSLLVAHNYDFDSKIIGSEFLRNGFDNVLSNQKSLCTMKSSVNFCKIVGPNGYKWPKLSELYKILFNKSFNEHNALDDVKATSKCFWELYKQNVISFGEQQEQRKLKTAKEFLSNSLYSTVFKKESRTYAEYNSKLCILLLEEIDKLLDNNKIFIEFEIIAYLELTSFFSSLPNYEKDLEFDSYLDSFQDKFLKDQKEKILLRHCDVDGIKIFKKLSNLESNKLRDWINLSSNFSYLPVDRIIDCFIEFYTLLYFFYLDNKINKDNLLYEGVIAKIVENEREFSSWWAGGFPYNRKNKIKKDHWSLNAITVRVQSSDKYITLINEFNKLPITNNLKIYYNNRLSANILRRIRYYMDIFSKEYIYQIRGQRTYEGTSQIFSVPYEDYQLALELVFKTSKSLKLKAEADKLKIELLYEYNKYNKHKREGCYIATMVYSDYNHPNVLVLREFRDLFLLKNIMGRILMKLKHNRSVNQIIKKILDQIVKLIRY